MAVSAATKFCTVAFCFVALATCIPAKKLQSKANNSTTTRIIGNKTTAAPTGATRTRQQSKLANSKTFDIPQALNEVGRPTLLFVAPSIFDSFYTSGHLFEQIIAFQRRFMQSIIANTAEVLRKSNSSTPSSQLPCDNVVIVVDKHTLPKLQKANSANDHLGRLNDKLIIEADLYDVFVRQYAPLGKGLVKFRYHAGDGVIASGGSIKQVDAVYSAQIEQSFERFAKEADIVIANKSDLFLSGADVVENGVDKVIVSSSMLARNRKARFDAIARRTENVNHHQNRHVRDVDTEAEDGLTVNEVSLKFGARVAVVSLPSQDDEKHLSKTRRAATVDQEMTSAENDSNVSADLLRVKPNVFRDVAASVVNATENATDIAAGVNVLTSGNAQPVLAEQPAKSADELRLESMPVDQLMSFIDDNVLALTQLDEPMLTALMKEIKTIFPDLEILTIPRIEEHVPASADVSGVSNAHGGAAASNNIKSAVHADTAGSAGAKTRNSERGHSMSNCGIYTGMLATKNQVYVPVFGNDPENLRRGYSSLFDRHVLNIVRSSTKKQVVAVNMPFALCKIGVTLNSLVWKVGRGPISDRLVEYARFRASQPRLRDIIKLLA